MGQHVPLMVTVKAYPAVSKKYGEVVCVAGVRTDTPSPEWVRLFPVAFRDLGFAERFSKYQTITVDATRPRSDRRPESLQPNLETLQIGESIGTTDQEWRARLGWVEPLVTDSMCGIARRQEETNESLGAFRPREVLDVVVEPADPWSEEKAALAAMSAQPTLFMPKGRDQLEPLPYRFSYRYLCADEHCRGHKQSIIDWELGEAWRSWTAYEPDERVGMVRHKWLRELCGPTRDPIFFVGNQHQYPQSFMVLGVMWPPRRVSAQRPLFS